MTKKWWHNKIAYQIYPKSFMDSNNDGIGDLQGIIQRLDYLQSLGIDLIWLSPIYDSPLVDQGYDISDYYNIHPLFGSMDDMDTLIAEAKKRNIHIIMDLVVNHCSDEHIWFKKALEDPDGEYGKYFYIAGMVDGKEPCNWRSYFGGSVWEPIEGSNKCYFHTFHKKQPDLNWENPVVRKEIYKNINWWLEKGISGFRVDAINNIKKPLPFSDCKADRKDGMVSIHNVISNIQGLHDFLQEMKEETFLKHDAFTVGEVFEKDSETLGLFIGEKGCFSSIFDFEETTFGRGSLGWYENMTINLLLKGVPFIYQGQEIGMGNTVFTDINDINDISSLDEYKNALNNGFSPKEALNIVSKYSRDNARTPMQWDESIFAGFSKVSPWLKVNPNYTEINVKEQIDNPDSVFNYYKSLIALRKSNKFQEIFTYGKLIPYLEEQKNIMSYYRKLKDQSLLIIANYQPKPQTVELPSENTTVLLNNITDLNLSKNWLLLEGYQVVVLEILLN